MKTKKLLLIVAVGITAGLFFLNFGSTDGERKYTPRDKMSQSRGIEGAYEWMMSRKVNQNTGTIDMKDVLKAQKQVQELRKKKSTKALGLEWIEMGPDNVGGRTRAFIFDNEDSNLAFAGGVAGGLFKSTTGGNSWSPVPFDEDDLSTFQNYAISCIDQAPNGDIYVGTGENFFGMHGTNQATPMIMGAGIYKSTDHGQSFQRLPSTWNEDVYNVFNGVNEIAVDPTNSNVVYAATRGGLRVSNDAGASWEKCSFDIAGRENFFSADVAIGPDGSVIAAIGGETYIKRAGIDSQFISRSGSESDGLISSSGVGRLEFAISPYNPDKIYCAAANNEEMGRLKNIYQSKDKGYTWTVIGYGGSADFQPFGVQGIYDNAITVAEGDPEVILVGGLDIWQGREVEGSTLFAWEQITWGQLSPLHPLYCHVDQHGFHNDPNDSLRIFIYNDGGIYRAEPNVGFIPVNFNYNVTQPYAVDCGGEINHVIGGTQDNGTVYIDGEGNTVMNAVEVLGGDGGWSLISELNPNVIFMTAQYGRLMRSNNKGGDNQFFYSELVYNYHGFDFNAQWSHPDEGAFVTPIALWETKNDPLSTDTILFVCRRDYEIGEVVRFDSRNIYKQPIWRTIERPAENEGYPAGIAYQVDDTIKIHDPYQSLFAVGLARQVWLTRNATNFTNVIERWTWYPILNKNFLVQDYGSTGGDANHEDVEALQFSADGEHLFFSTNRNKLYRSSNLSLARSKETASAFGNITLTDPNPEQVIESRVVESFGRSITNLAINPEDPNKLVVTLGNYGNSDYIYYTDNAATQVSSTSIDFTDKTGDLPQAPVYGATFNFGTNEVILATEYGVYSTADITAASPSWVDENDGLPTVPTMMIRQQHWPHWYSEINNSGMIYIGTHARGFFRSETLWKGTGVSIDETEAIPDHRFDFDVYPNPVLDYTNLTINLEELSSVEVSVYDLQGKLILTKTFENLLIGDNEIQVKLDELPAGSYIMNIRAGDDSGATKIVKY